MKRRLMRALITSVVVSSLIITPLMAAPAVDELEQEKQAAQNEVNSLQGQLTELMSKMNQLEEDLIAKGTEIAEAEEDLSEAEALEQQQYEEMKLRIKFMYEAGDTVGMVGALVESENFTELVNKAEYVQSVHNYDREQLEKYAQTRQEIADLKEKLEEEQKNMQSLQAEYEAQEDELGAMITSKQAEVANLDEQIKEAAEAAAREAEARRQAEEEARRQAEEAAAAAANNNSTVGGNAGAESSSAGGNSNSSGSSSSSANSNGSSYGNAGYNPNTGNVIVDAAYTQLGVPYVWGGTSPGVGLDCSGLTQYCYRKAGISIPRTSGAQLAGGTIVSDPQPGDICWTPGHVAIYIGGGKMIEAQQTGVPVCISNVRATHYVRY